VRSGLSVIETVGERPGCLWAIGDGIEEGALRQFNDYYVGLNPWQRPILERGVGLLDADTLVTRDQLRGLEYYNDWCLPWGVHDKSGIVLANDGVRNAALSLLLPDLGDRDRRVLDDTLAVVAMHLVRAYRVHERLAMTEAAWAAPPAAGAPAGAVVLCEADGRIVHASPEAEEVLRRSDGLASAGGRLRAADPGTDARLSEAIARTGLTARGLAEGDPARGRSVLRVPRRGDGRAYVLSLAPRPGRGRSPILLSGPDRVVVAIRDPGAGPRLDEDVVRSALGLTRAEAAVACALVRGETLQRHAAKRGVSVETARTLLRGVFRKTGCHRQSELVALVLALAD